MLNGRFGPISNKYTSVSYRGSAIVDYCIISTSNFHLITSFQIELIHDFMDKFNIHIDSIVPDHSILLWEFKFNNPIHNTTHALPSSVVRLPKQVIPQNYLEDEEALCHIDDLCSLISSSEGVDSVYAKFCSFISNSLHLDSFPNHKSKKENQKNFTNHGGMVIFML